MNITRFQGSDKPPTMDAEDIKEALEMMENDPSLKTVPFLVKETNTSMRII
jgi:hypothetical protein